MSAYPHTASIMSLFKAQLRAESAPVYLAIPTTSLGGGNPGELRLSPEFETQDALESFCEKHRNDYLVLDGKIRELGAVPEMFWQQ